VHVYGVCQCSGSIGIAHRKEEHVREE
jgi:hypothetical protein